MTNAKKKKPAARASSGKSKRKSNSGASSLRRTLTAFVVAAVGSFQVASCSLNPQWSADKMADALRTHIDLSALDQFRHPGASPSTGTQSGSASTRPSTATGFNHCPQFFPQGRAPALQAGPLRRELCFSGFAVLHDGASKTPVFVAERLNRQTVEEAQSQKRTNKF